MRIGKEMLESNLSPYDIVIIQLTKTSEESIKYPNLINKFYF